jgi:hypothetical protein
VVNNVKFEEVARMLRYGGMSFLHQLEQFPTERLHWKPEPSAKSAMEITAELVSAIKMYRPILGAADAASVKWVRIDRTPPKTVADARALLEPVLEDYVQALEASGPELARQQPMPFGGVFWAEDAATYPLIELFHHHGQICYLQTLLGDAEQHWDEAAIEIGFVRS